MNSHQTISQGEVHGELTKSSTTKTLAHAQLRIVDSHKDMEFESAESRYRWVQMMLVYLRNYTDRRSGVIPVEYLNQDRKIPK